MKKFLFVLLALTVMAMPAMASVQNIKVSGDIETTYLNRKDFDLGTAIGGEGYDVNRYRQSVILTQTRLRVDADLTDKVGATIALINERVWGQNETSAEQGIDLNLAYVTMKEMLYSPLTVKLGRQDFAFGNSFVIDSAGTNNAAPSESGIGVAGDLTKQTAQDALRLTFDYDPLTLDVLYSSINQGEVDGTIESDGKVDLYGINAMYKFNDDKNSVSEAYFWVKNGNRDDKIYMPGVRGSMNVLDGWNLQAEVAMQLGKIAMGEGKTDRRAYAAQILSNYLLPFEKTEQYKPVLGFSYTLYSGDTDVDYGGKGNKYTGWDPMYENQNTGKIFNTLFNATGSQTLGASLSMVPMQDVVANLYYDLLWLDKKLEFDLGQPNGTPVSDENIIQNTNKSKLGSELGMVMTYDYTEDVQFGARVGWFFPSSHFDSANNNTASQFLLNAKVAF